MAKSRKSKKSKRASSNGAQEASTEAMPVGGNFKKLVKSYVERAENLHDDLKTEQSKYMKACKPIRSELTELYQDAKGEGIPPRELKAAVKMRLLERQKEKVRDALDESQQNNLDQIRHALGDLEGTPLGDAAVARTEPVAQPEATY